MAGGGPDNTGEQCCSCETPTRAYISDTLIKKNKECPHHSVLTTKHSSVIFLEYSEAVPLTHYWYPMKQAMEMTYVSQLSNVYQDPNTRAQLAVFLAYVLLHKIHFTEFQN